MTSHSRRAPTVHLSATVLSAVFTLLLTFALTLPAQAQTQAQTQVQSQEPPTLADSALQQTVRIEDGLQNVTDAFRAIGRAAGIEVAFDQRFRESKVDLPGGDSTLADALDKLSRASASFWVATGPRSIFVTDDTPQRRREHEPVVVRSYRLRHAQLGDAMTIVRALAGAKHVAADETRGTLTVRDTAEQVRLVDQLIARHDLRPSETLVRLELVAIDPRTSSPHGTGDAADRDEVRKRLRENLGSPANAGRQILAANASIVGDGKAAVRVERSPLDPSTWIDLTVQMNAQARGDEILLGLEIESAVLRKDTENTRAATQSTWSSRSDQPLFVHLPLSVELDGAPKTLALRVTPKVVDAGETPPEGALWIGTDANVSLPADRAE